MSLSTDSLAAIEHFNTGLDHHLATDGEAAPHLVRAVEADPEFALGHFTLAMALTSVGEVRAGRRSFVKAVSLSRRVTRREQRHMSVMTMLATNRYSERAFALAREYLAEYPRDILVLERYAHNHFFRAPGGKGDALAYLEGIKGAYGSGDWAFDQMYAFCLSETGEPERATELARGVLATWGATSGMALHALAHVYHSTGDYRGGDRFLAEVLPGYHGPARDHLSFHRLLCQLELGRPSPIREWLERKGEFSDVTPELGRRAGGTTPKAVPERRPLLQVVHFMYRSVLHGGPPIPSAEDAAARVRRGLSMVRPDPWWRRRPIDLVWRLAARLARRGSTSKYATYLFGLAGAVDATPPGSRSTVLLFAVIAASLGADDATVARSLKLLRQDVERDPTRNHVVALAAAEGVAAFLRGDYAEAICKLEPMSTQELEYLVGSNVDREIVSETLLEAYLRHGSYDAAQTWLAARIGSRAPSDRERIQLARAQLGSGRAEEAARTLASSDWKAAEPDAPQLVALSSLKERLRAAEAPS
jgi:hypothetical protein